MKKNLFFSLAVVSSSFSVQAATVAGFDTEFYGFIKASSMYSSKALASYNNINLSAPTHAVAHTRSFDKTSRMSFQTQQSRLGVNLKKENISGKFEFDFIDFAKSSPTTQMVPRVRIASVTIKDGDNKIVIGQDWDLFSPVTSYTFDYVGLYFMAGNTGFMRQQAQYLHTNGQWEYGAALGMAGNNPGTTDADLELAKSPTYAGRIAYALEKGRLGFSGIYSRLNYATTNKTTHDSYGLNLFYENNHGALNIRSEAYYGQNLANIGALSLGKGTDSSNVKEFGGTLTGQYKLSEKNFPFAGVGMAKVDNRTSLTPFALNATNTISSPGIRGNFLARVGWEHRVTPDLSWVSEISRYETTSKLSSVNYQLNVVGSVETGVQLRF